MVCKPASQSAAELHGLDVLPDALPILWRKLLQPLTHRLAARLRAKEDHRNVLSLVLGRLRLDPCALRQVQASCALRKCTIYGTEWGAILFVQSGGMGVTERLASHQEGVKCFESPRFLSQAGAGVLFAFERAGVRILTR